MKLIDRVICFFLGIDYKDFVGQKKKAKEREICTCEMKRDKCTYKVNVSKEGCLYLTGHYQCGDFINKICGSKERK